ncbi:hypothetical protein Tco_1101434, partial [Tanacetum coccineum]
DSTVTYMEVPPPPDFVPDPVYPEFMPPEDDVLPAEEQPVPAAVSPTADSPGYITESDPEEDSKEDDEDPEEDPADYPNDKYYYEEEEESSEDDVDDEEEDEDDDDEEEEEEHLASADSVDKLLAISTPPPSPLTSYSSLLPQIPSPPLPVSSPLPMLPLPLPASPTHPLGCRATMIRLRAESPSTSHPLPLPPPIILPYTRASMTMMRVAAPSIPGSGILPSETPPSGTPPLLPIPLPTSSPPLLLPSTGYRADVLEVGESSSAPTARHTRGFKADYGFVGTLDAEIRRDPDKEISYGITNILEDPYEIAEEIPATDVAELGRRMNNFVTTVRQDTDEIYKRLDDAQDDRSLMSGQLNLLRRDRRTHARTARLMESEARLFREAWVQSMDVSDMARSEVSTLQTTVLAQQTKIGDLRAADRRRQAQLTEALTLLRTLQTQMAKMPPRKAPRTRTNPAAIIATTSVNDEQLKRLISQGVADVLAECEATRSGNGEDNHDSGMGRRRQAPLARECTYPDIMKCKPLYFKGTEGVVKLTHWFKIMETVFRISNCTMENQIKFATCTLLGSALTW